MLNGVVMIAIIVLGIAPQWISPQLTFTTPAQSRTAAFLFNLLLLRDFTGLRIYQKQMPFVYHINNGNVGTVMAQQLDSTQNMLFCYSNVCTACDTK